MPVHFAHGRITAKAAPQPRCLACAAAVLALLVAAPAVAQTTRYWAPDAGAGGSGIWNNADLFWAPNADGSGTKVAWDSTLTDNRAYFGGTAGTVTTGAAVSTNQIRFDTTGYLLAGDATNTITLNGTTPQVLLADGVEAEISAVLAGSAGFSAGASGTTGGTLTLSGQSSLSGTVGIGAGEVVLATGGSLTAGTLDVGTAFAATSTLRIKPGASMSFGSASTVGTNSRPTAAVVQEGGTASFGGSLVLGTTGGSGNYTGSSSYTLEAGSLTLTSSSGGFMTVGRNTTATFTQTGGTVTLNRTSDALTIGDYGSGTYTISAGSLRMIGGTSSHAQLGYRGGSGTLDIGGTAAVQIRGSMFLAVNQLNSTTTKGSATINLEGGDLAVNGITRGRAGTTGSEGAGSVAFTISGGTLRPYSGNVSFGSATAGSNFDITLSGTAGTISGLDASATPVARTVDLYANLVGAGGVTLSGGTINLRGTNTYSGGTTIGAGTVNVLETSAVPATGSYEIGSGGTFADSSGFATVGGWLASGRIATASAGTLAFTAATASDAIDLTGYDSLILATTGTTEVSGTVTPSATGLRIGGSGTLTISSAIGGSAGLTKTGNGTLVLSGDNTFPGTTTISAGTIEAGSATALGAGGPIAFEGGTLRYGSGVSTDFSGRISPTAGQNVRVDVGGQTVEWATGLSGAGTVLTRSGAGTLTLAGANTHTGGTTLTGDGETVIAATGSLAGSGSILIGNSSGTSALRIKPGSAVAAGTFAIGNATIPNAAVIQEGGDVTVSAQLTMANTGAPGTYAGSSTYELQGGSMTFTGSAYLQVARNAPSSFTQSGGTITIARNEEALIVGDYEAGTYTISAGSLTAATAGGNLVLGNRGGSGTLTINGPTARMGFNGAGRFAVNDSGSTGSSATVNLLAGELAINSMSKRSSTGVVNFTLGGGTLRPYGTSVATFGSATADNNFDITLSGTGSVISGLDATATPVARTVNLFANLVGSGGVTLAGGTINLQGANTYSGGTTIEGGTANFAAAAAVPATGTFTLTGGATFVDSAETATVAGWLASGRLATASAGTIAFGSGTATSSDALDFTSFPDLALGAIGETTYSGTLTPAAGGYRIGGSGTLTISSAIGGSTGLTKTGNGTLVLAGDNTFTGTTTVSAGSLDIGSGGTSGSLAGDLVTDGPVRFNRSDDLAYSGAISGTGGLTKLGNGTLSLSGANSHAGGTTLSAGRLDLGSATALGTGTFTLASGTTIGNSSGGPLTLTTNNPLAIGNITFAGPHDLDLGTGAGTITSTRTVTVEAGTLTIGAAISGSGNGIIKQGPGRLVLGGANTFTGGVTVSEGELTIASGGNLAGNATRTVGSATGPASVLRIKPGSAVAAGTFAIGNATIPNAAVIQEGGDVTVSAALQMANTGGSDTYAGSSTYELQGGSMTFTGSAFLQVARNATSSFTQSGGTITIARNSDALIVGDYADGSYTISAGSLTATTEGGNLVLGNRGGSGTLTINGPTARMALNGAGRFATNASSTTGSSATVNLLAGELALNGMSRLSSTGVVAFTLGGGTLRPYGADVVFGSATAGNNFEITLTGTGSVISGLDASEIPVARNVYLRTPLVGSGGVTLSGGTISLQSDNTHAGPTTIAPGTSVILNGSFADSSAITVNGSLDLAGKTTGFAFGSGQTLGGAGTIALPTTGPGVSLAGFLAPGNSPGTLTLSGAGTFDLTDAIDGTTGQLLFELGTPGVSAASDLVLVPDGTLEIGTSLLGFDSFAFTPLAGFGPGTYALFSADSISGALDPTRTTGSLGGLSAELTASGTEISLVVVPEPATVALVGAGIVAAGFALRRRRAGR